MTGYGKAQDAFITVEARSTNHRALDIQLNIPHALYSYEGKIREEIGRRFQRGRIELRITVIDTCLERPRINKTLARGYYKELMSLKKELSIPGDVDISLLSSINGIFVIEKATSKVKGLEKVLASALDELKRSRIKEGRELASDIRKRLRLLSRYLKGIEGRRKKFLDSAMKGMRGRIKELLDDVSIDEARLAQEIAIMVGKTDITEEIVRVRSHLKRMDVLIASEDTVGKKIDFYAQELRREINTIGSKALDAGISGYVVEMKHEVEKIREQAHNLQ